MKYSIQSIVLGGLVMGFGMMIAPVALAKELPATDLQDQLTTEINQQATTEVADGLADKSQASPTPTPTPVPTSSPLIINTGNNSGTDSSSQQSNSTTVANDNQADVNQTVKAGANTGDNTANRNISFGGDAGVIHTGAASVYSELATAANTNHAGVQGNCPSSHSGDQVINSGNRADVNADSSATCTTTITNGNGAVINQVVKAEANTGGNQAKGNISIGGNAGVITTGNAQVGSLLVVQANSNIILVGGSSKNGGPGSGANIYIINTGNQAVINDRRTTNYTTTVNNSNSANLNQAAVLLANTGDNTSNGNINLNGDAGVIHTGNAVIATDLQVKANNNQTEVAEPTSVGQSQTGVTNTGKAMDVDSSDTTTVETTVTNNNEADVNQIVIVEANTGRNTANRNIAFNGNAGMIITGNAMVTTSLETDVNDNQTVVAGGDQSNEADSSTDITNTGNDVEVDTSSNSHNSTTVTNTNSATVDQTVDTNANTGHNTASGNIGNTSISTGDVTIHTEVITNANNNYTFIIDSNITGLELFQQFVAAFLGVSWEDLAAGYNADPASGNDNTSVVNSGNNVTVLAEHTQNRQVVVNNTNEATVNQSVTASANTGNNSCNANVGDCQIATGDATIWTRLVANLNNTFTFIGNVQLPTPAQPDPEPQPEPEPEPSVESETTIPTTPSVLGESTERSVLPATGGQSVGLLGLGLLLAGASLSRRSFKSKTTTV